MSRLVLRYQPDGRFEMPPGACTVYYDETESRWMLHFCAVTPTEPEGAYLEIALNPGGPNLPRAHRGQWPVWGFNRVAPGEWYPDPSINSPSTGFHEFVAVVGAPEPPPWEPGTDGALRL